MGILLNEVGNMSDLVSSKIRRKFEASVDANAKEKDAGKPGTWQASLGAWKRQSEKQD